jgi:hypothetical protein
MPLVAFSVRLDRIDESLLFEAKDRSPLAPGIVPQGRKDFLL